MRNRIVVRWRQLASDKWALGGWLLLGFGLILLAASIPVSIWLIQRSGESALASGSSGTVLASGSRGDTASFGDSALLEIRRASAPDSPPVILEVATVNEPPPATAGDIPSFRDASMTVVNGAPEAEQHKADPAGDVAIFSDTASLEIPEVPDLTSAEPEPSDGGIPDAATTYSDTVRFVVRDSDGNIKNQGVVE